MQTFKWQLNRINFLWSMGLLVLLALLATDTLVIQMEVFDINSRDKFILHKLIHLSQMDVSHSPMPHYGFFFCSLGEETRDLAMGGHCFRHVENIQVVNSWCLQHHPLFW